MLNLLRNIIWVVRHYPDLERILRPYEPNSSRRRKLTIGLLDTLAAQAEHQIIVYEFNTIVHIVIFHLSGRLVGTFWPGHRVEFMQVLERLGYPARDAINSEVVASGITRH